MYRPVEWLETSDNAAAMYFRHPQGRPHPFGAGSHFCIGYVQAKLVLAAGLGALRARAPKLALAVDPTELCWSQDPFDGLDALPVIIG
jgi:hypothetical protein